MKHSFKITLVLVCLFLAAQIVGISLIFISAETTTDDAGNTAVEFPETPGLHRPETEGGWSLTLVAAAVAVGTMLVLLIIKFKAYSLWKVWFFLAVLLAMYKAFDIIMPSLIAFGVAALLAIWKIFKPNAIIHNLTEIFIYAGIAVLIAPLFDLFWAVELLIIISAYDMYAVWKSKHMVKMAEAQTKTNLFAGLYVPKGKGLPAPPKPSSKGSVAILGGGDIAFPLLFTSVVMVWLIEKQGVAPVTALYQSLIVVVCSTIALSLLFYYSKKGRFYPAMPFLTAGCFVGLGIIMLIGM